MSGSGRYAKDGFHGAMSRPKEGVGALQALACKVCPFRGRTVLSGMIMLVQVPNKAAQGSRLPAASMKRRYN